MVNGPIVSSETRKRQQEAREALSAEIDKAAEIYVDTLNDIAEKYKRSRSYVHDIAGIVTAKKAGKGHTTAYAAFCSQQLEAENEGKAKGSKTRLREFLRKKPSGLQDKYSTFSKDQKKEILKRHQKTKAEKGDDMTKNRSNIRISRVVDSAVNTITTLCQDLNREWKTEILFLFCRSDIAHTYSPGSFATEGAIKWLENSEIGQNTLHGASYQMEAFVVAGCSARVNIVKEAKIATTAQQDIRAECRMLILDGLKSALRAKSCPRDNILMNYDHYEDKIVENLGVELVGWPLNGPICQPGKISTHQAIILSNALKSGVCKWISLTSEQVEERKAHNAQLVANGEQVYGPPRKKRARKALSIDGEDSIL